MLDTNIISYVKNDRYGVKINNIIAKGQSAVGAGEENSDSGEENDFGPKGDNNESYDNGADYGNAEGEVNSSQGGEEDEDFDYSDFEVEGEGAEQ